MAAFREIRKTGRVQVKDIFLKKQQKGVISQTYNKPSQKQII